jgi:hypothetical protein
MALTLINTMRAKSGLQLTPGAIAPTAQQWKNAHDANIAMDDSGAGRFLLTSDVIVSDPYENQKSITLNARVAICRSGADAWIAQIESGERLPTNDADGLCGQLLDLFKQQMTHAATHRL